MSQQDESQELNCFVSFRPTNHNTDAPDQEKSQIYISNCTICFCLMSISKAGPAMRVYLISFTFETLPCYKVVMPYFMAGPLLCTVANTANEVPPIFLARFTNNVLSNKKQTKKKTDLPLSLSNCFQVAAVDSKTDPHGFASNALRLRACVHCNRFFAYSWGGVSCRTGFFPLSINTATPPQATQLRTGQVQRERLGGGRRRRGGAGGASPYPG